MKQHTSHNRSGRQFPFGWTLAIVAILFNVYVLTLALNNLNEYKEAYANAVANR